MHLNKMISELIAYGVDNKYTDMLFKDTELLKGVYRMYELGADVKLLNDLLETLDY